MIDTMSFVFGMLFIAVLYLAIDLVFKWTENKAKLEAYEAMERKRVGFGE